MSPRWTLIIPLILGVSAAAIIVFRVLRERSQCRRRRLDLLEEALKRGDMDPELQREVVMALRSELREGFSVTRLLFSLGWLGLFVGGGLALLGSGAHERNSGLIVVVASLAVVTLPLAVRQLETRREADETDDGRLGRTLKNISAWSRHHRHPS